MTTERPNERQSAKRRRGRPPKDGFAPATYVRLPKDLNRWVRRLAADGDRPVTITEQITILVRDAKRRQEAGAA